MCTGQHPYIPVADTVQVVAVQDIQGEIAENVFHFKKGSAWTSADLTAVANGVKLAYQNKVAPLTTAAWNLTEIRVTDLSSQNGLAYDTGVTGVSGTGAGVAVPNNVAAVISWGTAQRGRSFRGRSYIGGLASAHLVNTNQLDGPGISALDQFAAALQDTTAMAGGALAIVSYCNNKQWRTTGIATAVISHTSEVKLRTQRRRMPR